MRNVRIYGSEPRTVVVVHGGPGACGDLAPVALELSQRAGVVEPIFTERTIREQIQSLTNCVMASAQPPVTLLGHSWGAWLSLLFAGSQPALVRKIIVIGCPPFEPSEAGEIMKTRLARMSDDERSEFYRLERAFEDHESIGKHDSFARMGRLMARVDSYAPDMGRLSRDVDYRIDVFQAVWPEASRLRRDGSLLETLDLITCPVVAIHGDHDPHPAHAVRDTLTDRLRRFQFLELEQCGHMPWIETKARDQFFEVLSREATTQEDA